MRVSKRANIIFSICLAIGLNIIAFQNCSRFSFDPQNSLSALNALQIEYESASLEGFVLETTFDSTPSLGMETEQNLRWTIDPELPTGLSFDSLSGKISGQPKLNIGEKTYSVRVSSDSGKMGETQIALKIKPRYEAITHTSSNAPMNCAIVKPSSSIRCSGSFFYTLYAEAAPSNKLKSVSIAGSEGATSLDNAQYFGCAVLQTGRVRCWGSNQYGQLGIGGKTTSLSAVEIDGLADVVQVVTTSYSACALLKNGTVRCWGRNDEGQIGNGTSTYEFDRPQEVTGLSQVAKIAAGSYSVCAVLIDGEARCWGSNSEGKLGAGSSDARSNTPLSVVGISDAKDIAISRGTNFACALHTSGRVSCWGGNERGQLGNNDEIGSIVPDEVSGLTDMKTLAVGMYGACAMSLDDKVKCWGETGFDNDWGRVPVEITSNSEIQEIRAYNGFSAVLKDGSIINYGRPRTTPVGQIDY